MRGLKLGLVILGAVLLSFALGGLAYAFHSGGVAECTGCHSMHSPKDVATGFLLVGTDQSSTCLSCHQQTGLLTPSSYHVSTADANMPTGTAPAQRTPGGDFGWVKKTYTFVQRSNTITEQGDTHGHNIVAVDFGYAADTTNTTAPGGTFPAANLACNSCHDQHGQYRRLSTGVISKTGAPIKGSGSYNGAANEPDATSAVGVYRLLRGAGSTAGPVTFNGNPAAKAPSTYNQTEVTNQVRVAYGHLTTNGNESWGDWCATCHNRMHSNGNYVHPVDEQLGTIANNYNSYVKTGDLTGTSANSFTSLVPFIDSAADYATLATHASNNNTVLGGPTSQERVSCVTCHRAHASGFPGMLRFSMENEFMVTNGAYQTTTLGRTATEAAAGYYDRPPTPTFATYQRVLCNKCHAKD
jgi:predicted CXXCH cytochrome family protein